MIESIYKHCWKGYAIYVSPAVTAAIPCVVLPFPHHYTALRSRYVKFVRHPLDPIISILSAVVIISITTVVSVQI